ncbi:hypothetical protein POM88_035401 [Heracleum sosnowskyi]|uniref:RRM domain-containing protein n=1 Tax=Heracleum sosnowskyi TaxID=360622 RepID=A0AAD8HLD4_9APIA|nr:hypothetical protein POM88_035401 [Heracleum sosnowskyi]
MARNEDKEAIRMGLNQLHYNSLQISEKASAKEIWNFFMRGGKIVDIALPRKGDKFNNMYGFVKLNIEEEAINLMFRLKDKRFKGMNLRMTLARRVNSEKLSDP